VYNAPLQVANLSHRGSGRGDMSIAASSAPKLLLVVASDQIALYQQLARGFDGSEHVQVILDRRTSHPGHSSSSRAVERRSTEAPVGAEEQLRLAGWFMIRSRMPVALPVSRPDTALETTPSRHPADTRTAPSERSGEHQTGLSPRPLVDTSDADQGETLTEHDRHSIEAIRAQLALKYGDANVLADSASPDGESSPPVGPVHKRPALALLVGGLLVAGLISMAAVVFTNRGRGTVADMPSPAATASAVPAVTTSAPTAVEPPRPIEPTPPSPVEPPRPIEPAPADSPATPPTASAPSPGGAAEREVRAAFNAWAKSINRGQLASHLGWYADPIPLFYGSRNVPRREVMTLRAQTLKDATRVDVRTSEPEIRFGPDRRTATMVFRKAYVFEGPHISRRGAILQELVWRKTNAGWRIIVERTLRELANDETRTAPGGTSGSSQRAGISSRRAPSRP
jgi:hypothetical protein